MRKQKEMKHVPDEELALRAQAGSKEAEEVLVKRYWDIASIEARQYVVPGVEHEDRTMIAISDGLIKAIRTFAEGQGSKFKSWAKLLMRRALIECYRQAMQASEVPRTAMLRIDEGSGIDGDDTTLADVIAGPDDTEREVISGLYVAGAPQGGRFNVQYPISLKGLSCGMCMVYGKIAGENAAAGK